MDATDRAALIKRINALADAGLLSDLDRNIRITNARHADTETELQMMGRDLLQWESRLPGSAGGTPRPVGTAPVTLSPADPTPQSHAPYSLGPQARKTFRFVVLTMVTMVAVSLVAQGVVASLVRNLFDETFGSVVADASEYALDEPGINALFGEVEERFSTTSVIDLSLYEKYALVAVSRSDGSAQLWYFGDQIKQIDDAYGGGEPPDGRVDLERVNVAALVDNVNGAPLMLGIDEFQDRYVLINPGLGAGSPQIAIYVVDAQGVGSFVMTRLNGKVVDVRPPKGT